MIVAKGNLDTALTILNRGGISSLVIGSLLQAWLFAPVLFYVFAAGNAFYYLQKSEQRHIGEAVMCTIAGLLIVFISSLQLLVSIPYAVTILLFASLLTMRHERRAAFSRAANRSPVFWQKGMFLGIFVLVAFVTLTMPPWYPEELVALRSASHPYAVYVLGDSGEPGSWTSLVFASTMQVVDVPASSIVGRANCANKSEDHQVLLFRLIFGSDDRPIISCSHPPKTLTN